MNAQTPAEREAITDSVRRLYEEFPFPPPLKSALPPAMEGWCNYTFLYYQTMNEWRDCRDRWILDAGCGTGETLWPLAVNNPGAQLVGYDLSAASIDAARDKLARLGVPVTFERHDLQELPQPTQQFDIIFCTGVLHHLADPLKGLRNLVRYLKPDGIMVLMFYAEAARADIRRAKEILALLGGHDDLSKKIEMARRFFNELPRDHALRKTLHWDDNFNDYREKDAHIGDTFFHPREVLYTVETLFDLLDSAGLEHVRFFNEPTFELRSVLKDADLQQRIERLTRRQKYHVADLIDPQGNYSFIARHAAHHPALRPQRKEVATLIPVLSPVVVRTERVPLAAAPLVPRQSILEVSGFARETFALDENTRQIIELCDGQRTAGQIAERYGRREEAMEVLLALEARSIIFFRQQSRAQSSAP